jgi:hypothetical protein
MSSQEINYTNGSDTGERDAASVAPINPGEKVKAAIFDRPIDNLRNRSEVLRDEVIDQKYLQDTDIMWLIADGDAVTGLNPGMDLPMILWDPVTGTFMIGPFPGVSMVLQPIKTPGQDTVTSGGEDVVYTFVTDTITITSFLRNYAGGNRREVRWVWDAGITGTALAFLSGSPNHILTIHVASDGTTQVTDVDNALLALGASLGAAGFAHGVTGGGDLIAAVPADHLFAKIHEREMHRIPQSQFAAFFATHSLVDGDTLAIAYDVMAETAPGIGGRRQACPTNGNITLTAGSLFITTQEPEKIPIGIPICKRIGNDLIFIDGTVCYGNAPGGPYPLYTGEHGYTVNRILTAASWVEATITSQWYGPLPLSGGPLWTIDSALNNIIGDLATVGAPSGAQRVGMAPTAAAATSLGFYNVPVLGDSVASTLLALITLLNTKASLGLGAAFDTEEVITGRWKFNNHVRLGSEKVILREVPSNSGWKLCYRNYRATGQTEVNSQVTPETYSVYESANDAGDYGQVLEVFGAYSSSADEVVSAAAGVGKVLVIKRSNRLDADGSYLIAHRINSGPGVTLNIYNPAHWDYYQHLSHNAGEMSNHVRGQDGTSGRPLTKQYWHIPQSVQGEVDFTTTGTGLFGERAQVKVNSSPWSLILEGMFAQPESAVNPFAWTPDTIRISGGRALVNGKPYTRTSALLAALSTRLMNGVVLPTSADDGDGTKIPAWYYLWLRSDNNFFIGKMIPEGDWSTGGASVPGFRLHRPQTSEVHVGYTEADYTLVDVVALLQVYNPGTGDEYYWDVAPPVGGSERRYINRPLPSTSNYMRRDIVHVTGDTGGAVWGFIIQNGTSVGIPERRVPGIPSGVTEKAIIGYAVQLTTCIVGASGIALFGVNMNSNPMREPTMWSVAPAPQYLRSWSKADSDASPHTMYDSGEFDITSYLNSIGVLGLIINDATIDAYLYVTGFHWDRRGGVQS